MSSMDQIIISASSWNYGTYQIGDQQRLRWTCASTQSCQRLRCSHTWCMEVDEGSNQISSPTGWLHMCVWRMSLRKMKSAIISWAGSNFYLHSQSFSAWFITFAEKQLSHYARRYMSSRLIHVQQSFREIAYAFNKLWLVECWFFGYKVQ